MAQVIANQNSLIQASVEEVFRMRSQLLKELGGKLSLAKEMNVPGYLKTGLPKLDECLGGGLEVGGVSEWGMPSGHGSRILLMNLITRLTNDHKQKPVLWVLGQPGVKVFATAWMSLGVEMSKILFANSFKPLKDLREVFMEPAFSLVVLDSPKSFSKEEYAFISKQAQKNSMHVAFLQNYLLSEKIGNVWARKRLNCKSEHDLLGNFQVKMLRGGNQKKCSIRLTHGDFLSVGRTSE
jgi:predicted ATP-dependent serine protease